MAKQTDNPWWLDLAYVLLMCGCLLVIGLACGGFGGTPSVGD